MADDIAKKHASQVSEYLGPDLEAQLGIYLAKDIEEAILSFHHQQVKGLVEVLERYTRKFGDCGDIYSEAIEALKPYEEELARRPEKEK